MGGSVLGAERCVGDERKVDPRVWYKVGLELVHVHVQGSVKPH